MSRQITSVAVPVILSLVGVTTLLMAGTALLSDRLLRTRLREDLTREQALLADQVAVALALPAWNFDREQIERVLDGSAKAENVTRLVVRLEDRNGTTYTRTPAQAESAETEERIMVRRDVIRGEERLGTLELEVTTRLMEQRLQRYRMVMLLVVAAIDLLLVAGLYVLLWRTVLRPLREIEAFATGRTNNGSALRTLGGRHYGGELETLRQALETMIGLLQMRHSELQDANESLEAERAKLRALFSILPAGVSIIDENRRVVEENPALERILGISRADLAADRPGQRQYFDAQGEALEVEQLPGTRALREQREISGQELMIRKEDGTTSWISVSAAPLANYGAAVATVDITERKRAEERLQQQLTELKRWQMVTLGREDRIRQLKVEINDLCRRLGLAPRYQEPEPAAKPSAADGGGKGAGI